MSYMAWKLHLKHCEHLEQQGIDPVQHYKDLEAQAEFESRRPIPKPKGRKVPQIGAVYFTDDFEEELFTRSKPPGMPWDEFMEETRDDL